MTLTTADGQLIKEILRPEFEGMRKEVGELRQEMNQKFEQVDKQFEQVHKRFDAVNKVLADLIEATMDETTMHQDHEERIKRLEQRQAPPS